MSAYKSKLQSSGHVFDIGKSVRARAPCALLCFVLSGAMMKTDGTIILILLLWKLKCFEWRMVLFDMHQTKHLLNWFRLNMREWVLGANGHVIDFKLSRLASNQSKRMICYPPPSVFDSKKRNLFAEKSMAFTYVSESDLVGAQMQKLLVNWFVSISWWHLCINWMSCRESLVENQLWHRSDQSVCAFSMEQPK